jgi:transcriptional regulator with XRE-family HTH domain
VHHQGNAHPPWQGVPAERGTASDSIPPPGSRSVSVVSSRDEVRGEIRQFLATRRAKITPEKAGLTAYGRNRRVTGLRREEVALLAGISIEYYTRLERGDATGVSDDVLDALARALQLDDVERAHLLDLIRTANARRRPTRRRATGQRVRPSVQRILDSMTDVAAFVRNGRLDILSANQLGYGLYSPAFLDPTRPVNLARFVFLDPRSREFYGDWDGIAHQAVGSLRAEAGRDPYDRALTDLVGELSTRSEQFRVRWAGHDVKQYRSGAQPFRHPLVGDLVLSYDALEISADPGLTIVAYTAEPGSPAQQALDALTGSTSSGTTATPV